MRIMKWSARLGLFGAAVAGSAIAATALAAEVDGPKVNWDFSLWGNPRSTTLAAQFMVDNAVAKTGGNFAIKMHWGETLSPIKENIDGIKIGAFQLAFASAGFHPGKVPTWEMISLPFLPIQDLKIQARVMTGYYLQPAVAADGARWSLKVILPTLIPSYQLMGVGQPPKTIGDLKGRRIRGLGQMSTALAKVGAVPTSMPSPELLGSLERGLLDAVSLDPTNFKAYRIHEVGKWYTTNLSLGLGPGVFIVGLDAYNKLPPQYRKVLEDGGQAGLPKQVLQYETDIREAIELYDKSKLTAVTFGQEDIAKFQEVARPIWDAFAADLETKGYPGRQLLEWLLAEAKKVSS